MSPNQPFDIHEVREVTVLVSTSSPDSSSSTGTGSLTLLNPESSLDDAHSSSGSSHATLTVKFAPLPQIDPSRKRSLAPLGAPWRSRRKRAIQEEGGSLLWSADPDVPEESTEDPIIVFAKYVKRKGKTLWQRVRKGSRVILQENVAYSDEPVLDIKSPVTSADMGLGDKGGRVSKAVGLGDTRGRRASWSPLAERRTLSWELKVQRRSTGDLSHLSVVP